MWEVMQLPLSGGGLYGDSERADEELLAGKDPQEVFAPDGLLVELKKALAERILDAEMDQHLVSSEPRRAAASGATTEMARAARPC